MPKDFIRIRPLGIKISATKLTASDLNNLKRLHIKSIDFVFNESFH